MENKDEFLEIFAELHWPVTRSDLMALVKEIENGRVYMEQSISLRASANEGQASLKVRAGGSPLCMEKSRMFGIFPIVLTGCPCV